MNVSDALATFSEDDIETRLLTYLPTNLKVTSWQPGAFFRTLMEEQWLQAMASFLGDPGARLAIVSGGYPGANADDWLTLTAEQLFNVERNIDASDTQFAGTRTVQTLVLACDNTHGPFPIIAGAFWVKSAITGNRYVAVSSGTLPNNGTLTIAVQSEFPQDSGAGHNYSDGEGTLTVLENVLPGVTCSNVAPNFSPVTTDPDPPAGAGVVTVTGSRDPSPTAYDIQILASGQVSAATFQYRENGGSWSEVETVVASFTIPSGPTVHFANDPGGSNPSFIAGDIYSFTSPGTAIQQQGLDPETDSDLLGRCYSQWPDLTVEPSTVDKREEWAKRASALVTRVKVRPDPTYPGRALVTIAGAVNPLSGGVVTAVQTYIDQHEGICDLSLVAAATAVNVTATGIVEVPRGQLLFVQASAAVLWNAYVNADDIAGTVELSVLEQFLRDVGATDVSGLELNGVAVDLVLGTNEVAYPEDIIASLTWQEV